ncbi:SDR family NAD(P)-dependent oxidoreductase [Amycolatopsis alba]|uniref:SDR family oxidoreductase n=1 Tax=Amycolatopsis alba DSM 44262 TaxID=1125972 RepID=A0A229S9W7_AMYAL|nr:SDR family NAD(P)-dependent oxidoreductase [Amycolatopsis alba]OXM55625.1 SDR family oxidoreductase [Amycolatopsis alba DSM 44262]
MTGENQIIVITGASSGIGARAAVRLAGSGATVALVGRDTDRLGAVAAEIEQAGQERPETFSADFARLSDVHELATRLRRRYDRIDVLLNNAGIHCATRKTTVDGNELTNQVNHLAPFLLTRLLEEMLTVRPGSRVVGTGSLLAEGVRPDDLNRTGLRWSGWGAYKASKQANALFALEFVKRAGADGPIATCCHPGMLKTSFGSESAAYRRFRKFLPAAFKPADHGASTLVKLALDQAGIAHPGAFFIEGKLGRTPRRLADRELAAELWDKTDELLTSSTSR